MPIVPNTSSAVVLGASMAGLGAARILSDRFARVLVVDRDALPDHAAPRDRVPQARHPHLLLVAGARILEGWFPGIVEELHAGGAVDLDLCGDMYWYQGGGISRRPPSSLRGPAMSRPFLEHTVRQRLAAIPGVTVRDTTAVDGLDCDGGRITGVRLADGSTVAADLVVDATGRQARSLRWLERLGYEPPATSVVGVDTRYVTQVYRRHDDPLRDWKAAGIIDDPDTKRLAMALPTEGDRWLVMLGGLNGESPPTGEDDRRAYVAALPSPVIAALMDASEPVGPAVTHHFPANLRRHVEKLRRFPSGWVLLGDAVCSFDPIYGQGMTSAMLQAEALGRCLDRSGAVDRSFARRYFRAAGRVVSGPWSIAIGGDFAYAGTTGRKPPGTDLVNRYIDRVTVAAQHDDAVALRFNEVAALVRRPEVLMRPAFAARTLLAARRGPVGTGSARQPDLPPARDVTGVA
jgi:2-polyprenyl-6-methoxyphenol hydroxylase-like FAD-dependent oxidoreductase